MAVFKFRNVTTGQAMPIPPGEFSVGRLENSHVRVDDPSVSRAHARLINAGDGLFIEDLGSSNGTAYRGAFIAARTRLSYGEVVHIGSVPFRIDPEVSGEPEPEPSLVAIQPSGMSMRRNTERIPALGEAPRVIEAIPSGQLSAPTVSQADADAEELNAVIMREPEPPAPVPLPTPVPQVQPAASPQFKQRPPSVRITVNVPTPQQLFQTPRYPASGTEPGVFPAPMPVPQPRPQPVVMKAPGPAKMMPPPTAISAVQPESVKSAGWPMVPFLSGLGAGLLLGFILAWLLLK